MKHYILTNDKWKLINLKTIKSLANYHRINLYDDDLILYGVGLYLKM